MTRSQQPSTLAFRAVNSIDNLSSEPSDNHMIAIDTLTSLGEAGSVRGTGEKGHTSTSISVSNTESARPVSPDDMALMMRDNSDLGTDQAHSNADSNEISETPAKPGKAKKKKGSKFHCEGFGDCKLTFTRSEHLARHIRKHTGERPFMCHCGRWFSRLDNLRQHSSTVHADEEIPTDSLAATGTRYQRHLRTDRVRQPARSRAQSLSDVQSPEPQTLQSQLKVKLGSPGAERQARPRPDPLILPHESMDDVSFGQYRSQTPPESPASSVTTSSFHRSGTTYRQRSAPYPPPLSQASSPTLTPTIRGGGTLDSPFSTPNSSSRNSLNLSAYNGSISPISNRRLSMPAPPTPSLFDSRSLALPPPGGSLSGSEQTIDTRRESLSSIHSDDRRKTWHVSAYSPMSYQNPLPRDVVSPTIRSFARTTLQGNPGDSPIVHGRLQLPSITDILSGPNPAHSSPINSPITTTVPDQYRENRLSWSGSSLDPNKPVTPMEWSRNNPEVTNSRRVIAPGQMRSSHGRSISNIETKRWGVVHQNNSMTGGWPDRDRREMSLQPNVQERYFGRGGHVTSTREHRQSFGSSGDSSVSEGINTPVPTTLDVPHLRILGEPGDVFPLEVKDSSNPLRRGTLTYFNVQSPEKDDQENPCTMSGVENTSGITSVTVQDEKKNWNHQPQMYENVSRLDALVSVATGAAKICPTIE